MTNMNENDLANSVIEHGELTSLVRRWMATGTQVQDRVRRESILRVAPEPERVDGDRVLTFPPLPQRTTGTKPDQVNRVALLIDARRLSADVAAGLIARVAERGSVNVCRAYADWSSTDLGDWASRMRREGLHSFHHFSDGDEQALVAMAIDAVDIARDAAVDEVVIAGDLTSALPLVHRLHAAGVRVVAVGAAHTPHDVRAACDEFVDTEFIGTESVGTESVDTESTDGGRGVVEGRHRA